MVPTCGRKYCTRKPSMNTRTTILMVCHTKHLTHMWYLIHVVRYHVSHMFNICDTCTYVAHFTVNKPNNLLLVEYMSIPMKYRTHQQYTCMYTKSLTDSVYINVFKSVAWMLFALTNLQYLIGNSVQMTQKLFLDNQLFCLSFYYRAQTDMTFKVNTVRIKASLHISH